jgi:beta-lactam-binding protein with PASTA domain
MGFFYFLGKKKFYLHFFISIILTIVLIWAAFKFLDVFTRHGDVYLVPDFSGQMVQDLREKHFDDYFDLKVIDSIYDKRHEPGSIVMQNPLPGAKVKQGRHIYLTIVARMPEMVEMPNLRNLSLRQAMVRLDERGLKVDHLEYVEYFAKNAVVDQLLNGEPIEEATRLPKGTAIALVVGKGEHPDLIPLPFLIGKSMQAAHHSLHDASLNVGREYYLDVTDSAHARVYQTEPRALSNTRLNMGDSVNIWYRSDENFDFKAYIEELKADTSRSDTNQIAKPSINNDTIF